MYIFRSIIVSSFLFYCYGETEHSEVAKAFTDNQLVPNIIDEPPQNLLRVNYSDVDVNLGNDVNPLQTLSQPSVFYEANEDNLYTLAFFGPDLPLDVTPPYTQFLHWLIVNIPGENIEGGNSVAPYFPPTPYPCGLPYLFVLYEQKDVIDTDTLSSLSILRPGFDVLEFKNNYTLTGPIAGNFMKEAYISSLTNVI